VETREDWEIVIVGFVSVTSERVDQTRLLPLRSARTASLRRKVCPNWILLRGRGCHCHRIGRHVNRKTLPMWDSQSQSRGVKDEKLR